MFRFIAFAALFVCVAAGVAVYSRDAGADGGLSVRLDCDTATAGVQDSCVFGSGLAAASVAVVLQNNSASTQSVGSFNVDIAVDRRSVLNPVVTSCDDETPAVDCNPNFNDALFPLSFVCNPPLPVADLAPRSEATASRLVCYGNGSGGPSIAPGASLVLGTVSYTAGDGLTSLRPEGFSVANVAGVEIGSCSPVVVVGATCAGASVQIGTPTVTPTPTATPVITNPPTGGLPYGIFLDCDPATPGLQSVCNLGAGPVAFGVDVYLVNNTTADIFDFTFGTDMRAVNAAGFQFDDFACPFGDRGGQAGDRDPSADVIVIVGACIHHPEYLRIPAGSMLRVATARFNGIGGTLTLSFSNGDMYYYPDLNSPPDSLNCMPPNRTLYCGTGVQVNLSSPPPTSTPTPAVTATASPTPAATCVVTQAGQPTCLLRQALDCDIHTVGIQEECAFAARPGTIVVDYVVENIGGLTLHLGTFGTRLVVNEQLLQPVPGSGEFDSNPDFAVPSTADWGCSPPVPRADTDPSPLVAVSFLSCYNGFGTGPRLVPEDTITLARISYRVGVGVPGDATLTLTHAEIFDASFGQQNYCESACATAIIHIGTDNCPGFADPDQANTNDEALLLPKPLPAWNDDTNPAGDYKGDVCDPDIDGDGLLNGDEEAAGTSDTSWDSDGDRTSDGAEVVCGSDPKIASSVPGGSDADNDALPDLCELQFGTTVGVADSDGDGLTDGLEVRYWLTNPLEVNTDHDDCSDGREVATINGDRTMNSGDLGIMASKYGALPTGFRAYDQNGDGIINSGDLGFAASKYGSCSTAP